MSFANEHEISADDDFELITEMSGHSGCRVLLYRSGAKHFVRKISGSSQYNERLALQEEKQRRLAAVVSTPPVLGSGTIGDFRYFDMEYARGHDFKVYAPLQSVVSLAQLSHRILDPVQAFAARADGVIDENKFTAKVASVCAAVQSSKFFSAHQAVLFPVIDFLHGADWSNIVASPCHGDLTLENLIIAEDNSIVMIDLLDGDLESFWMDIAKLLQDLDSGWSLRTLLWKRETSSSERLVGILSRFLYDELLSATQDLFPEASRKLKQLRALQAMRVLPYVRDEHVFWHVVRGLDRLFE